MMNRRFLLGLRSVTRSFALVMAILLFASSCDTEKNPLVGHWTVDKVSVDFDENRSTPQMVKQIGEMEKGNVIDINIDSTLLFISDKDTTQFRYSLEGNHIYCGGEEFAELRDGVLMTSKKTVLGAVKVSYKR